MLLLETLIADLAAKLTRDYGRKSLDMIAKHSEMAAAIGDRASLDVWRSVAAVAERLLAEERSPDALAA